MPWNTPCPATDAEGGQARQAYIPASMSLPLIGVGCPAPRSQETSAKEPESRFVILRAAKDLVFFFKKRDSSVASRPQNDIQGTFAEVSLLLFSFQGGKGGKDVLPGVIQNVLGVFA